jgi:hypothetical protein
MVTIEHISFQIGDQTLFADLTNSFEGSQIHGVWNSTASGNTAFLQMLAGNIPIRSGIIRYGGQLLDHTVVAYYNTENMPWIFRNDQVMDYGNDKWIYLFDNMFSLSDFRLVIRLYKVILLLKKLERTIIITSTDYKELIAATDFFHILSNSSFPLKLDYKEYDLLHGVFRQMSQ